MGLEEGIPALEDPDAVEFIDDRMNYDEERWVTYGRNRHGTVLAVVWTERGPDWNHLISARLCSISVGRRFRGRVLKRGSMPRRAGVGRAERGFLPCPGIGLKSEKGRPPRVAGARRRGRR